jgi:GNAT superfamily N-acetyltransferase
MKFHTYDHLSTSDWKPALDLYHQAFPKPGRKPDPIIVGMFTKKLSFLHTVSEGDNLAAMAVTGLIPEAGLLLIDYLTVRDNLRGQGIGRQLVRDITAWAKDEKHLSGILLEAEAESGQANAERIQFWESCGFTLTEYVHKYIWVPETYQAMYVSFGSEFAVKDQGQALFRHIESYHKKAFQK